MVPGNDGKQKSFVIGRLLIVYFVGALSLLALTVLGGLGYLGAAIAAVVRQTVDQPLRPPFTFFAEQWFVGLGCYLMIGVTLWFVALFVFRRPWREQTEDIPKLQTVCVTLTAYDHEDCIEEVVIDFLTAERVVEVLVIDNNSTDRTAELAQRAGARVIKEPRQGFGFACRRALWEGFASGADVIVLAEGDRTFRGQDVGKLLEYCADVEMVVGTRTARALLEDASQMDHWFTWGNLLVAKMLQLRFWESKCFGQARFTDLGCTMRAMRRSALEQTMGYLSVGGNTFNPHMLMVALARGVSVVEVPIGFRKRVGISKGVSGSHWRGLTTGLQMLWEIIAFDLRNFSPETEAYQPEPRASLEFGSPS